MKYDRRHFSERVAYNPIEVDDAMMARMLEEDPDLTRGLVEQVVAALNWQQLADPVGTVRKSRSGRAMAIRVPSATNPWEVVWLNGTGGGYTIGDPHKWPLYDPANLEGSQ